MVNVRNGESSGKIELSSYVSSDRDLHENSRQSSTGAFEEEEKRTFGMAI